jgi:uncharacterized metal-binding protein
VCSDQTWGSDYNPDQIMKYIWDTNDDDPNHPSTDDIPAISPAKKISFLNFFMGFFYFIVATVIVYLVVVAAMRHMKLNFGRMFSSSARRENQLYSMVSQREEEENDNL